MGPELHAIVMAGGSGTRFWPASRQSRPKQFLPLARGESLIGATVDRAAGLVTRDRVWIVTNPVQAERLPDVLPDFPRDRVIVEPEARDTAPCVALAAATIEARHPGATMAVMPADHVIEPVDAFHALLERGARIAADETTLVTFGIEPTRPATGYGYIEIGEPLDGGTPAAHHVVRFREKPDAATAESFVASGRFLWNSGIFVWTTAAILAAMETGSPELAACTRAMLDAARREDATARDAAFRDAPKTSIDFAVMEKAPRVAVVRATVDWHDLGSFLTLDSVAPTDATGNVQLLNDGATSMLVDASNCVVYGEGQRTVTLFGTEDLVVVAVGDAVLVCPKDRADDLKQVVTQLRESGRADVL